MRFALVISSLGGGGAERVMTLLANAWVERGDAVTLITLAAQGMDAYPLDPAVHRVALNLTASSAQLPLAVVRNAARVRALRRAITACRPDVVISFIAESNVRVLVAATGLRVPVIISERTFVNAHHLRGIWQALRRYLYPRAAAIVAQTRRCASELEAVVGRRVEVIANPVLADPESGATAARGAGTTGRVLLAVGRLSPQKGFDLLIEAFARVAPRHRDWNLTILGEGALRVDLTQAIAQRGLAGRVLLPGFDPHVRARMRAADLFVLSSRYEGFPNALLEAMAEGAACVSFDCDVGPRELITHGDNGWLVPPGDAAALAVALDALMDDAALRQHLGQRARAVSATYALPAILEQWNAVVTAALAVRGVRAATP